MMNQSALLDGPSIMQGLFQRIEDKVCLGRPRDPPSHDAISECVDDEGHINKALPCRHVGKVMRHCLSDQWRDNGSSHSMFGAGARN